MTPALAIDFTPQSTFQPRHAGIILDGNGRWARERGLPRSEGHRRGAAAVERTIQAAVRMRLEALTLFAFSSDNWCRPQPEVQTLMELFETFLKRELPRCLEAGIRLTVIGRRDRLSPSLHRLIVETEKATALQNGVRLRIAIDYSARHEILSAFNRAGPAEGTDAIDRALNHDVPPVDLIIRTGRETRLSDFLLWEAAYAELLFLDTMWPDFTGDDLIEAAATFRTRQRRFGRVEEKIEVAR